MSLAQLTSCRSKFDSEIEAQQARELPDEFEIQKLKKLKLLYKDEIAAREAASRQAQHERVAA
ncbi:hypothetical protein CL638_00460 [bacterium]|nr:hypothetical protein [bacterium]